MLMDVVNILSVCMCCNNAATLLSRSSAILGLGTVLAKNHNGINEGDGASTRATAKPTSPSTTAIAPVPWLGPELVVDGRVLEPYITAFNPSFMMPPVRTPRYRVTPQGEGRVRGFMFMMHSSRCNLSPAG